MRFRGPFRCAFLWLALAACGDNIEGIKLEEFGAARREAECQRLTRCGLYADVETCVVDSAPSDDPDLSAQVAHGKIRFDPIAAEQCDRALAQLSCDVTSHDVKVAPEACSRALVGTVAADGACVEDRECGTGRCTAQLCERDQCCVGGCEAYTAPGDLDMPCTPEVGCVASAYCGKDLVCHPLAGMAGPCNSDLECIDGLGCVGATELESGACRPLPKIGESCPYLRCAEIGARCDGHQTCVAVSLEGDACDDQTPCADSYICDGATHRCAALPQLGMPCTVRCGGEAYCTDAGMCAPPQSDAAPCTADNQCASRYCAEGPIFDQCMRAAVCF